MKNRSIIRIQISGSRNWLSHVTNNGYCSIRIKISQRTFNHRRENGEKKNTYPSILSGIFENVSLPCSLNHTSNTPQVLLRSLTPMYEHDATRGEIRGRCTLCLDARKPGRILPTLAIIDLFRIRGCGHKREDNKEMNTTVEEIFDEFSLEYNIKIRNQRE